MRHFTELTDVTRDELVQLLREAARLKAAHLRREPIETLKYRIIALIFEKPSLRTHVSFEAAIAQLGGSSLFLDGQDVGFGWRETLSDFMRSMNHYVDALVLRVFKHSTITGMQAAAKIPIVNGLSDEAHPCQAVADLLTIQEACGTLEGVRVAYLGDGTNVARSLAVLGALAGVHVTVASPPGYALEGDLALPDEASGTLTLYENPYEAVAGAQAICTDVWVSMGQEEDADRLAALAAYRLDDALLDAAAPGAFALHCLPAHPGQEITAEVLYGQRQRIWDQAENRRHAQKALLELLLRPAGEHPAAAPADRAAGATA